MVYLCALYHSVHGETSNLLSADMGDMLTWVIRLIFPDQVTYKVFNLNLTNKCKVSLWDSVGNMTLPCILRVSTKELPMYVAPTIT